MTGLISRALILVALLCAVAVPPAVSAATASECQTAIDELRTATADATFIGKNAEKEEAGLLRKLDGASEALAAGKFDDAVKKLTDYRFHAVTIAEAGKLDPGDAAVLTQLADDAIACVGSIGA